MFRIPAAALAVLSLVACGGGSPTDDNSGPAPVASIAVTLSSGSAQAGATVTAAAVLRDGFGKILTDRAVTWASSNGAVATIGGNGSITALTPGSTTITATSEGKSGTADLTVTPVPVASVSVSLASSSVTLSTTTQATAVTRDAATNVLTGRNIAWSSSNTAVATISPSGAVTTVAAGTANIIATSEGKSGSAPLTVTPPAVASVVLTGALRVKVGDAYTYAATARLADGTVVQRPLTWGVLVPGTATITQAGLLTPLASGTITIVMTIDGVQWTGTVAGYDWQFVTGSTTISAQLDADIAFTTRLGSTEYPRLLFVCGNTGLFSVGVAFPSMITANGIVTYAGDNGTLISDTWLEVPPNFNIYAYPGSSNASQKAFAAAMGTNHIFTFAFTEFLGTSHATQFRLTGMSIALAPILAGCPGNSLMAGGSTSPGSSTGDLLDAAPKSTAPASARATRGANGPARTPAPIGQPAIRAPDTIVMHRAGA